MSHCLPSHFRSSIAIAFAFAILAFIGGQPAKVTAQSPRSLPKPRAGHRVIDDAKVIQTFAVNQLEELCSEVSSFKDAELVILTIRDTGGLKPRDFALQYFNTNGIGKANSNKGILVFAAMNQRRAEIVLGKGFDSRENNKLAESIARDFMVARFKRNDPGAAMFGGGFEVARKILGMENLADQLERETNDERRLRKRANRDPKWIFITLAGGGCLLIGGISFLSARHQVRYGKRNCKNCSGEMLMLDETQDDEFLDRPEVIEEEIGSVEYDVWACLECESVLRYRYGRLWTRYSRCPKCRYQTKSKIEKVLRYATQKRGGKVRVVETCVSCDYHRSYVYKTPRLPKPSKKSRGGKGRSGGGWSGGFGGGSRGSRGGSSSGGGGGASW